MTAIQDEENIVDLTKPDAPVAPTVAPKKDHFWWSVVVILLIFIPLRIYVAEPFLVYGTSMSPTFETGDYLIIDELTYKMSDPQRGDVIVLHPPLVGKEKTYFIKRIIGLPGETVVVADGKVMIKNAANPAGFYLDEKYDVYKSDRSDTITLKSDEYFVMGDNRPVSDDSRNWGPLKKDMIGGRVLFRLYPFSEAHFFPGSLSQFGLDQDSYVAK